MLHEPEWLSTQRARANELRRELPLPHRAEHRWRYVDPARLQPGSRPPVAEAGTHRVENLPDDDPAVLVIRRGADGTTVRLSGEARGAGVMVLPLAVAAVEHEELVRPWLGQLVKAGETPFTALNAAGWTGGLFLHVPKHVALTRPIRIETHAPADGLALPRNLLLIGDGAEVSILEELTGTAADASSGAAGADGLLVHRVNEVVVGAGARLEIVVAQELPTRATTASVTRIRLERDAFARELFAAFGAGLAKADLTLDLQGAGASCDVLGAVFGTGRQAFDHHTILEHRAPDTSSNLDVRVALAGKAKSSSTGRLYIGKEAVRSQAYQENRNLLLSEQSSAVSIPELEILTDEVQAKHGATVGPIDDDQLYYLQARGLSRDEATAMIVAGFFEALLARIPEGSVQERVRTRVEARLAAPVPALDA